MSKGQSSTARMYHKLPDNQSTRLISPVAPAVSEQQQIIELERKLKENARQLAFFQHCLAEPSSTKPALFAFYLQGFELCTVAKHSLLTELAELAPKAYQQPSTNGPALYLYRCLATLRNYFEQPEHPCSEETLAMWWALKETFKQNSINIGNPEFIFHLFCGARFDQFEKAKDCFTRLDKLAAETYAQALAQQAQAKNQDHTHLLTPRSTNR